MVSIELKARAKINLSLDVIKKRGDGYHEVKMIMQTIDLHDEVSLERTDTHNRIEVQCDSRWAPSNQENIAFKAAELLVNQYRIKDSVKITIKKKIPVAAGLAGGSSDAAAVLKGMNSLFSLGIGEEELMCMGKKIGADVPYCIKGGTVLAEGIGEILTGISPLPRLNIILIKPKAGVSTAWVYKNLDFDKIKSRPDTDKLIESIQGNKIGFLARNMKNVLETVTIEKYGVIREAKNRLLEAGADGSMMSGSGPTVFGIFRDKQRAENALRKIRSNSWKCILTHTINGKDI